MLKNEKGFTLIEMLIVLMIISVLIILIIPNLSGRSQEVHEKGCQALMTVVQAQVDLYELENGETPTELGILVPEFITSDQTSCSNGDELTIVDGEVVKKNN